MTTVEKDNCVVKIMMTTIEEDDGVVEITLNEEEIKLVAGYAKVDMGRNCYIEDNFVRILSIFPTPFDLKNRQKEVRLVGYKIC